MATAAVTTTTETPSLAASLPEVERINSINDFIVRQSNALPDIQLISYPSEEIAGSGWTTYTARDLDQFADEAAKELTAQGLKPSVSLLSTIEIRLLKLA